MCKYVKASLTSGLVGIWWLYNNIVISDVRLLEEGYNDGNYINYDERHNHATEWCRLVNEYFPDKADEILSLGYKGLERGRVIYNLRTQAYEVTCSQEVFQDIEKRKLIIEAFELGNCRCDFFALRHYYLAPLTGNPALDELEYGI